MNTSNQLGIKPAISKLEPVARAAPIVVNNAASASSERALGIGDATAESSAMVPAQPTDTLGTSAASSSVVDDQAAEISPVALNGKKSFKDKMAKRMMNFESLPNEFSHQKKTPGTLPRAGSNISSVSQLRSVEPPPIPLPKSYKKAAVDLPQPPPPGSLAPPQHAISGLCDHVEDMRCDCTHPWSLWATRHEFVQDKTVLSSSYTDDNCRNLELCHSIFQRGFCRNGRKCTARHWKPEANERLWMFSPFIEALDKTKGWDRFPPYLDMSYRVEGGLPRLMRNGRWCLGYKEFVDDCPDYYVPTYKANVLKGRGGHLARRQARIDQQFEAHQTHGNRGTREGSSRMGETERASRGEGGRGTFFHQSKPHNGADGTRKGGDRGGRTRQGDKGMASRNPATLSSFLKNPDFSLLGPYILDDGNILIPNKETQ
jgi:hypothetical protein